MFGVCSETSGNIWHRQAMSGSFWKAVETSSDDMDVVAASGTPRSRVYELASRPSSHSFPSLLTQLLSILTPLL